MAKVKAKAKKNPVKTPAAKAAKAKVTAAKTAPKAAKQTSEIKPIQRPVTGETAGKKKKKKKKGAAVPKSETKANPEKKPDYKKIKAKLTKKQEKLDSGTAKNPERLTKKINKLQGKLDARPGGGKGGDGKGGKGGKLDKAIDKSNDRADEVIEKGKELGKELGAEFEDGALGRIDTAPTAVDSDIMARRQAALAGLSEQEVRGIRETGQRDLNVQVQQSRRNVLKRLAQTNSRGGAAAAALGDVERERVMGQAAITAGILNRNIDLKRQALNEYEGTATQQQGFQREGNVFNLQQGAAELAGRTGAMAQGIGLQTGISAGLRGEGFAQQGFNWQKKEAKRARQHQLEMLDKQLQAQRDMFSQARADAEGTF